MSTQKRPLSGMVGATGLAQPVKILNAATTLHTLGSVPSQQGGPFFDDLTVVLSNTSNGAKVVDLALNGVVFASISVGANATIAALVDMPFASARDVAASVLTALCATTDVVFAYGWFARPL